LLINDDRFIARARVLREKGTDRFAYERGEVARYTWIDGGSSYLVSELVSAYLYGQLQFVDELLTERQKQWQYYFSALARLESEGFVRLPAVPAYAQHNAHIFYLL